MKNTNDLISLIGKVNDIEKELLSLKTEVEAILRYLNPTIIVEEPENLQDKVQTHIDPEVDPAAPSIKSRKGRPPGAKNKRKIVL
jgi:hypothetical protein